MRGRRVLVPLGALLVLLGAGTVGDWYAQNREIDRLLRRVEAAEATINRFLPTAERIFREHVGSGPLPPDERARLFARITAVAEGSSRAVADRVEAVDELRFLPWHRDLADARDSYVHHAGVWQAYLRNVVRDADANYPKRSPEILRTYRAALADLRRAVPPRPSGDVEARIERLEPD